MTQAGDEDMNSVNLEHNVQLVTGEDHNQEAEIHGDPFASDPPLEDILASLDAEEVILGDQIATYEGTDEKGEVILHMEDGSYQTMPTTEVLNHLSQDQDTKEIESILNHQWAPLSGKLILKVKWYTGDESLLDADTLKEDNPMMVAQYILDHPMEKTRSGYWNKWAQDTVKNVNKTLRRLRSMYDGFTSLGDLPFRKSRRVCRRQKADKGWTTITVKFGVEVPRNVKEALAFEKKNGDSKWAQAIQKEMKGLLDHETFKFLDPGVQAPSDYQFAPLRMIFDVKPDGTSKARLVIGGHVVDSSEHSGYSSVVKLTSTRILNIIAKSHGLQCLAGDVGNAYLNAPTREKVFVRCGLEFGEEFQGRVAIVVKSLYGLKSSGNRWHAHFANTLHAMGFKPSRFDHDVWWRLRGDGSGYDYISTYVDDFLIMAKDAWAYMRHLQSIYTIKKIYLGAL